MAKFMRIRTRGGQRSVAGRPGAATAGPLTRNWDLSIELRILEVDGRKKRQMRIAKARGQRVYEDWVPIYIGNKAISIDVGEDPAKYERLKRALRGTTA